MSICFKTLISIPTGLLANSKFPFLWPADQHKLCQIWSLKAYLVNVCFNCLNCIIFSKILYNIFKMWHLKWQHQKWVLGRNWYWRVQKSLFACDFLTSQFMYCIWSICDQPKELEWCVNIYWTEHQSKFISYHQYSYILTRSHSLFWIHQIGVRIDIWEHKCHKLNKFQFIDCVPVRNK